jgi:hypothetical protein
MIDMTKDYLLVFVLFLFLLVVPLILFIGMVKERAIQPCYVFENYSVANVPLRCLKVNLEN